MSFPSNYMGLFDLLNPTDGCKKNLLREIYDITFITFYWYISTIGEGDPKIISLTKLPPSIVGGVGGVKGPPNLSTTFLLGWFGLYFRLWCLIDPYTILLCHLRFKDRNSAPKPSYNFSGRQKLFLASSWMNRFPKIKSEILCLW